MYKAVYMCRLCGEVFSREEKSYPTKLAALLSCDPTPFNHDCKNGDVGIADIQGFKKVGD